jgi:hypothetical protein
LDTQVDSFLFVSLFRFQQLNLTTTSSIHSTISYFNIFDSYNFKLDEGLLHPLVFENVISFYMEGTIQSIEIGLFKHFKLLKNLIFHMNSVGNFYHQIGIEWMNYLNIKSAVDLRSSYLPYTYPDRDFCIFALFPVNRSINIILNDTGQNAITLTYAWLCKAGNIKMSNPPCNQAINWTMVDEMLKLCKIKRNVTDHQSFICRLVSDTAY